MHAAVFVDFENLFASLQNRSELSGQRTRDLALAILEQLVHKLQDEGSPMVLGRSYAAFDTFPGMEVAHDLALMGFDPQYVLVSPTGKNSADVQLAVDVCRVLFRRADIEKIVIVSGDRDFIPIARQVIEENRELRWVAIPDVASGDLRMRVGGQRFWNALDMLPAELRTRREPHVATATGSAPAAPIAGVTAAGAPTTDSLAIGATPPVVVPSVEDVVEALGSDAAHAHGSVTGNGAGNGHGPVVPRAAVVGHIPVTWRTTADAPPGELQQKLELVVDLLVKARIRHSSREIWLSPFLKGAMSQHFSGLVHPERRALINELRHRGVIRVEERENQFADHPYSVIVMDEAHAMVHASLERTRKRGGGGDA